MWRRSLTVSDRFSANYNNAMDGEPFAVFELLDVFQDCQMNQGVNSKQDIESTFASLPPSPIADAIREVVEFHFEGCSAVWAKIPSEGAAFWDFRNALVSKAVNKGSATAKLMEIERERWSKNALPSMGEGNSETDASEFSAISLLLNDALRTKDHRAFHQARSLLNYFGSGLELQVDFWNHAICHYDPHCDLAMYQSLDTHLFTHETATINEAIRRLDDHLDSASPIPFEVMFTSPLQLTSGQMWFEGATQPLSAEPEPASN